jgi:A/G-specific adenine glycosylase
LDQGINLAPVFTVALLRWYDVNRRKLPWRDHPDPYAVLVSEFMLQQTTVPAVIPRFEQWIKDFPTIEILASEEPETVLLKWEGLGYYSRARNLHLAAKEIVSKYGGKVPDAPADLKKLPGIGDYTAAAMASIAYGVRAPALDANNIRVWSRLLTSNDRKRIAGIFARILPSDRPGDFNQALMDLGTSVCTPRKPECPACPLSPWCRAYKSGRVGDYPKKKERPETVRIEAAIGIILKDERVLVQRRPEGSLLAGMWEFPGGKLKRAQGAGRRAQRTFRPDDRATERPGERNHSENPEKAGVGETSRRNDQATERRSDKNLFETPEEAVVREIREETGLNIQVREKLGVFNHSYTRFRVKLHVYICKKKSGTVHNPTARWVTLEELEGLAMPSVNRRIVKKLEERLERESG